MRYYVHWRYDPDVDEWHPKMLFEVDAEGNGKALNPGLGPRIQDALFDTIHAKAWKTAQGVTQHHPEMNRIEEISKDDVSILLMELQMAKEAKRGMGDIRKGDYLVLGVGDEEVVEDTDFGAYGRVLEPVDKEHFLFLVLGVDRNVPWPFLNALVYETDGKTLKRKVEMPAELEPGKIYAVDAYAQMSQHAAYIRHVRETRTEPGWIHVPDEELDVRGPGPKKPRR